ncbi:MAG: class I fructose-bisphosphate aldolase [Candidatus Woesearchaeota archaeon]
MKRINIKKLFTDNKTLMLAYDQGLEHGPIDLDERNVDPNYVIYIAIHGNYNAFICTKGVAEKYHENYHKKIPLVVKLNGKTSLSRGFPIGNQICSVKKAVDLGASAVGYVIYVGSPLEPEIFENFSKLQEEAHDYGLPVIAWMYPRGRYVTDEMNTSILAYSARAGLELGADLLKIKYNEKPEDYKWVVKCAGKVPIAVAGGPKLPDKQNLERIKDIMATGTSGMAIGRNVWQHESPMKMTAAIRSIIFNDASVEEAIEFLK